MLTLIVIEKIQLGILIGQFAVQLTQLLTIIALIRGFFNEMILKMIRVISFFLDNLIMKLIDAFYKYFNLVLNGDIFEGKILSEITNRIYLFIGILIFFKLAITVIKYVTNPDLLDDKKTSVQAIIKRIIIAIASIAIIPFGFRMAFALQNAILSDGIIETIIMGDEYKNDRVKLKGREGKMIGFTVFNGFFTLNEHVASSTAKNKYEMATKLYDADRIGVKNVNMQTSNKSYMYNYTPILSTAALLFVFYMMFQLTIQLAVRVIKLGVLQIISPLVIASSIAGTDEEMPLNRWLKNTLYTYLSVFIYVATLWFVVFVSRLLTTNEILVAGNDILLKSLLYVALFIFIKDAPKLFGDIFKIQENTDSTKQIVNSLFKQTWAATKFVGGATLGAGLGFIGGVKGSLKQSASSLSNANKGLTKVDAAATGLSAATGGLKGTFKGAIAGGRGNLTGAYKKGVSSGIKSTKSSAKATKAVEDLINKKRTPSVNDNIIDKKSPSNINPNIKNNNSFIENISTNIDDTSTTSNDILKDKSFKEKEDLEKKMPIDNNNKKNKNDYAEIDKTGYKEIANNNKFDKENDFKPRETKENEWINKILENNETEINDSNNN